MLRKVAELPLHCGSVPKWLFERQKRILFEISRLIILEFGTKELIERLSDPLYFQILGCISGFDWHSSGVTTTVTAALKEAFKSHPEYGIYIFGGKGKTSRKTPDEIMSCEYIDSANEFVTISKLAAKVDNTCIQDGYQLYHHTIFVDRDENWCVVQQGMNINAQYARRYHWYNRTTTTKNNQLIIEPHSGIISEKFESEVLNCVDKSSENFQKKIIEYIKLEKPENMVKVIMPQRHYILKEDFDWKRLYKTFCEIKNVELSGFKDLVLTKGLGPKTLRALCLISETVYGEKVSLKDPARFSFAFGGKDGHPYPVDKKNFDKTIDTLKKIVDKAYIGEREKLNILKQLSRISMYNNSRQ